MLRRIIAVNVVTVTCIATVIVACGGDDASDAPPLSERASAGLDVYRDSGCASCHGVDGQGDLGPDLTGLYGSEVTLEDGSTVTADDAYLRRAIADPGAERVDGFEALMPANRVDDAEIDLIIAWIRET